MNPYTDKNKERRSAMKAKERQEKILQILRKENGPVAGTTLASLLGVSRQIIVQDVSTLRKNGANIIPTSHGYLLHEIPVYQRVFKVIHTENEFEDEASIILDNGGKFLDIFVYHKVYGVIRADMKISNREEMLALQKAIQSGKSSMLMNITSGYHYHTVETESEQALDVIQEKLNERGFLAKLQDYEPVDFWKKDEE